MKKLFIVTFLFLIVGTPLSVKADYEAADEQAKTIKQSLSDLYCSLQCIKELQSCLHQFEGRCYQDYFECRGECTGEDSEENETLDIEDMPDNLEESPDNLEAPLDNGNIPDLDLAPLVDTSEIQCKLICALEYQECRNDQGLQGIRTCLNEREECKEACESESEQENAEDDEENYKNSIMRNLQ